MNFSFLTLLLIIWCSTPTNGFSQRYIYQNRICRRKFAQCYKETESNSLNSAAITTALDGDTPRKRESIPRAIIPLSTHLTIGYFTLKEMGEVGRDSIGHAHGLASLTFAKLLPRFAKTIPRFAKIIPRFAKTMPRFAKLVPLFARLQTQVDEINENVEKIGEIHWDLLEILRKVLVSPILSMAASLFAVIASVVEIFDDVMPGGHHGMALLAMSEFQAQFRRFRRIKKENDGSYHKTADSTFVSWMKRIVPISAALFASWEIYNDLRPGAHHGVLLLTVSELVENIYRAKEG